MYSDDPAPRQLSRDECLALMASVPVGRIIYTTRALPAVDLVHFALEHGDIVIGTDRGGKLASAVCGAVVAFEADCLDPARQAGWSVTAIGPSSEVTGTGEIARLRAMKLNSWAPGPRDHYIRIAPVILTGRLLHAGGATQLARLGGLIDTDRFRGQAGRGARRAERGRACSRIPGLTWWPKVPPDAGP